ncbi:hypothetical protein HNV12_01900 [Methanococcoides sp. SA1]|nr:hypothetical protein [Methanococcoides sp. SA1]
MGSRDCLDRVVLYNCEGGDILGIVIGRNFVANGCDSMREMFCAEGKDVVWTKSRGNVFIDEIRADLENLYFCPVEYLDSSKV